MSHKKNRDDDDFIDELTKPLNTESLDDLLDDDNNRTIQHHQKPADILKDESKKSSRGLLLAFLAMVIVGLGNKVFQVLLFIPMTNYPLFVNMLTTFVYLPMSFAYIIPMLKYGTLITKEATQIPKYKFAVMGLLDSLAGIIQSLSVNYINNGPLVVLLTQTAIPISLVISYALLGKRYKLYQYVGACIVMGGVALVLYPPIAHPGDQKGEHVFLWSIMLMASCIPMCLSSVYKERALGEVEIDAVYMNGWIAVYQFIASIPLLLPGAPATKLEIQDIPKNFEWGAKCLVGINSVINGTVCTPHYIHNGSTPIFNGTTCQDWTPPGHYKVDDCARSPIYVFVYLAFNLGYNVLILLILKFGSANILWLALTIMVPLANLAFAIPIMPEKARRSLNWEDIVGLIIIMGGLIGYRFWGNVKKIYKKWSMSRGYAPLEPMTPGSPFMTSKRADDTVSTPGRGGPHTFHKNKNERAKREAKRSAFHQDSPDSSTKNYGSNL